jgi:hypothetical protein
MRVCGCQNKRPRTLAQRLHVLRGQRQGGEFYEIALMQKFSQQPLMPGKRGVCALKKIAQKLLRGAARDRYTESLLDIEADNIGCRGGELPCARRLHERADGFQPLQRNFVRQQNPCSAIAPPAPQAIDTKRNEHRCPDERRQQPLREIVFRATDVANILGERRCTDASAIVIPISAAAAAQRLPTSPRFMRACARGS